MKPTAPALRRLLQSIATSLVCVLGIAVHAQKFANPVVFPTGNWPTAIYTADVNNDGNPDLIYIDPPLPSGQHGLHVLLGDGAGNFRQSYQGLISGAVITIADFNGDGNLDFAGAESFAAGTFGATPSVQVSLLLGDGKGSVSGSVSSTVIAVAAASTPALQFLASGHVTQTTGPIDLVVEDTANSTLYVFQPASTTKIVASIPLAKGSGAIAVADLNHDGLDDIVLQQGTSSVTVLLGKLGGLSSPGPGYPGISGAHSVLLHDIDNDGNLDLILEGAAGRFDVFHGNGDGTFKTNSKGGSVAFDGTTGNGGFLINATDRNGGYHNIYAFTPAGVGALIGQGNITYPPLGIYNAGPVFATGSSAKSANFAVADFNRDGNFDLAVTSPEGIAILYGNADGSFQTNQAFAAGQPAHSASLGVFTKSGHLDTVVGTAATQAEFLKGNSDGTFTAAAQPTNTSTGLAGTIGSVFAGDFNQDGLLDILTTADGPPAVIANPQGAAVNPAHYGVSLQYGNGDGTFQVATLTGFAIPTNSCQPQPYPLFGVSAVADFAHDGFIGLANRDRLQASIYAFGGSPGLVYPDEAFGLSLTCNFYPHNVAIAGDLTGDKLPDVVLQSDGHLSLWPNTGIRYNWFQGSPAGDLSVDGSLTTPGQLTAPALSSTFNGPPIPASSGGLGFPAAIGSGVVADLDKDGNNDLIVSYANLVADPTNPSASAPNYIYIWFGSGNGKFLTSAAHPVNPVRFSPSRNFYQLAVTDVNGDGIPDLVMSDGYILSYQLGKGDGTFGAETHLLAGQGLNTISIGDTRGTGQNDIVVANGGAVFGNPVANKDVIGTNPDVNTGGITVLLNPFAVPAASTPGNITASPEPSIITNPFALTATLMPNTNLAIPGGMMTFSIDGISIGAVPVTSVSTTIQVPLATYTALAVGPHAISATYSGDNNFQGATYTATHDIIKATPAISVTLTTASTLYYGQDANGTFALSGVVLPNYLNVDSYTVQDNGVNIAACINIPINAPCNYGTAPQFLPVGVHNLTIVFPGDADDNGVTSSPLSFTVIPDPVTATLTSSLNPSIFGNSVTFTATLLGNFAPGVGPVNFFDGPYPLATVTPNSAGVATFTTSSLAVGTHPINVGAPASLNFQALVVMPTVVQVVNPAVVAPPNASVTVSSSLNPSMFQQLVTFTAVVTNSANSVAPTGTVTFLDGSIILGNATLTGGMATFATSGLAIGSHPITVAYSGDTLNGPGTSGVLTQVVNPAIPASFTLNVLPNPITAGVGAINNLVVTVTPTGTFNQAVQISCSNLPYEAACSFYNGTGLIPPAEAQSFSR